jgi:hypothetical protein
MAEQQQNGGGRSNPFTRNTLGQGDEQSGKKARAAAERAREQTATVDGEAWPRGVNGQPMMKITMTASELIPTGQYANVSVGPAQITAFVDQDRLLEGEAYFSERQRQVLAQAMNELAEIVEGDVVAVQRNLVLESMQEQIGR